MIDLTFGVKRETQTYNQKRLNGVHDSEADTAGWPEQNQDKNSVSLDSDAVIQQTFTSLSEAHQ